MGENEYPVESKAWTGEGAAGDGGLHAVAPMPGIVERVLVREGEAVKVTPGLFSRTLRLESLEIAYESVEVEEYVLNILSYFLIISRTLSLYGFHSISLICISLLWTVYLSLFFFSLKLSILIYFSLY